MFYNPELLLNEVRQSLKPPPELSISQWAGENIIVSQGSNPGKYDPEFMPYQNGIMDAVLDPTVEKIVVEASARIGKTFTVTNILGYFMKHDPTDILYMRPVDDDIKSFSKKELAQLIANTPGLQELVAEDGETYNNKIFPGGSLKLIGSNSPTKLAGYGVKIALLDEIDKYHPIPGFGNPVDLAEERTAEYALAGRKIIYISTPTTKAENSIDWLYDNRSDRRLYYVPCPFCGHHQILRWENVRFGHCRQTLDDVFYQCEACQERLYDTHRLAAMRKGEWRITNPDVKGFAGFRINRLYSPLASLQSMAKDFLNKKNNILMLRQFINDALGEAFDEDQQAKASTSELFNRRERYHAQVPYGVGLVTMAVDVQGNTDPQGNESLGWLEYNIMGWGQDRECWILEHGILDGSPAQKDVWDKLLEKVNTPLKHESGASVNINLCVIDTQGGYTDYVYDFLKGKAPKIIGVFGAKNKANAPLLPKRHTIAQHRKIKTWEVGTTSAKDTLFTMLSIKEDGPNKVHFCHSLDEEYFAQLLAEKKEDAIKNGVKVQVYKAKRKRNEALDLFVYNLFAFEWLNSRQPRLLPESLEALKDEPEPDEPETEAEEHQAQDQALPVIQPPPVPPVSSRPIQQRPLTGIRISGGFRQPGGFGRLF